MFEFPSPEAAFLHIVEPFLSSWASLTFQLSSRAAKPLSKTTPGSVHLVVVSPACPSMPPVAAGHGGGATVSSR